MRCSEFNLSKSSLQLEYLQFSILNLLLSNEIENQLPQKITRCGRLSIFSALTYEGDKLVKSFSHTLKLSACENTDSLMTPAAKQ